MRDNVKYSERMSGNVGPIFQSKKEDIVEQRIISLYVFENDGMINFRRAYLKNKMRRKYFQ